MDLENVFGMTSPVLSEILWETVENFVKNYGHLVTTFKFELMKQRAPLISERVKAKGAPLEKCVGFLGFTKIRMQWPGGINVLKRHATPQVKKNGLFNLPYEKQPGWADLFIVRF